MTSTILTVRPVDVPVTEGEVFVWDMPGRDELGRRWTQARLRVHAITDRDVVWDDLTPGATPWSFVWTRRAVAFEHQEGRLRPVRG